MKLEYLIAAILPVIIFICLNPKWRRTAKCNFKYFVFFIYFGIVSILVIPLSLKHPANSKSMWAYAMLLPPVSKLLGINWEIRHTEKVIGDRKSAVFIANHQSMYDIVGMLLLWHRCSLRCGIVARNFFFWVWPVGLGMWFSGVTFIKRKPGLHKTKQCFNEAAEKLFNDNEKLWIYVEGTRNKNSENLMPFKKGAFVTAIQHQVPVQPVVFSPFYFIDLKKKRFDSGKVIIEVMDPVPTEGLTMEDLDDFIAKMHAAMSEKNKALKEEMKDEIEKYNLSISRTKY